MSFLSLCRPLFAQVDEGLTHDHDRGGYSSPSRDGDDARTITRRHDQTRFQAVLAHLVAEGGAVEGKWTALAVADRSEATSARNRVTFPLYDRAALGDLIAAPADAWRTELQSASVRHRDESRRVLARLEDRKSAEQARLFRALPLHKADAVISYWGALERRLPDLPPQILDAVDFCVTTTGGPATVVVIWGVGARLKARITRRGAADPWAEQPSEWRVIDAPQ